MTRTFLCPPSKRPVMADHLPSPSYTAIATAVTGNGIATKRSNQPPPLLVVPAGHTALRLLCRASLVGGFIGKSGSSIKHLQRDTGSKIRVEDSLLPTSDDRVIVIIAAAVPLKKFRFHSGEEGVYEAEVSSAQKAAVRVFEKVLEMSASEVAAGVSTQVVSCRLLVDADQAGSVIGKGGKVVEKLRRESGAKIRVLLVQELPSGVSPPLEIVEIEGKVLAVKKALLGVCGRLQECPVTEKSRAKESRPLESRVHPAVPDSHIDQFTAISGSTNSTSSTLVGRPLLPENNKYSASDPNTQQQEVVFKILCYTDRVGGVIGRGGSIIKALEEETGATIITGAPVAGCNERLVTITSMEDVGSSYSPAQRAVILVFSRYVDAGAQKGLESGSNKSTSITARLLVPSNQVGCLMGKGGAKISKMRKATGTGIRILRGYQVPHCASEDDELVEISGQFVNVQDALYQVTGKLRNNLFVSRLMNGIASGIKKNIPVALETSLGERVGDAPMIRLGLDPLRHPLRLNHSASPDLQISEITSVLNPRTFVKPGRVASAENGVEIVREDRLAIVTNTTVEILIPESAVGSAYGDNGSNIARIRQISGAKVILHEPYPGSGDRTISISGTPDETHAAQSLLHAFFLTAPA